MIFSVDAGTKISSFIKVKYLPGSKCGVGNSVLEDEVVIGLVIE
jgi:hypothetical protein